MHLFCRQLASLLGTPGPLAPQPIGLPNPQDDDRRILLKSPQALTLSCLDALLQAPLLPVDHWLWLQATAVSGSPAGLTVAVRFS